MSSNFEWFVMIWIAAVLAVAIFGVALQILDCRRERGIRSRSALDTLDERYARGEIDADEYKKWRTDLGR